MLAVDSKGRRGRLRRPLNPEDDPDEMVLPEAAAPYVGTTVGTLRGWRSLGKGPVYYKDGAGQVLYKKSDLDAFNEARLPRRIVPGGKGSTA
jgi:hypothetical protein